MAGSPQVRLAGFHLRPVHPRYANKKKPAGTATYGLNSGAIFTAYITYLTGCKNGTSRGENGVQFFASLDQGLFSFSLGVLTCVA